MKKFLLSSVAVAAMAGNAIAADLPSIKSAPVVKPTPMWTGFYAGLNAGGMWAGSGSINFTTTPSYYLPTTLPGLTAPNANYVITDALAGFSNIPISNSPNFLGGGQIGYSWKFLERGLFSLEADFQGTAGSNGSQSSRYTILPVPNNNNDAYMTGSMWGSEKLNYLGTVRGRLGYLISPNLLAYGTAGFAYGGVSITAGTLTNIATSASPGPRTNSNILDNTSYTGAKFGWTAGAGVEWMFLQNWSVKAEYLYYDLGSKTLHTDTFIRTYYPVGEPSKLLFINESFAQAHLNGNIIRAGVNYHFNFANLAPLVAKY